MSRAPTTDARRELGERRAPDTRHPLLVGALILALRVGLGGIFLIAGVMKLSDPSAFAVEIHNYQLLPDLAPVLAATLPTVEIAIGAAMAVGPRRWAHAGAFAATLVLGVFTVAVASVVIRGINITCGCFGEGSGPVTALTVLRDIALVAAALALSRWTRPDASPEAQLPSLTALG
jgi:putative oxidoreductase